MLALLGLAQQGTKPDIASGIINDVSYTNLGTNANPFHYDSVPLTLTMPDGSVDAISDPSAGGFATTTLDAVLNNAGQLAAGPSTFSVTGSVMVGAAAYDGTLLTGQVSEFGFAPTVTPDSGEFEARIAVTGGLLTQAGGPYKVGDSVGLLIHQPNLGITSFPNTFSFSTWDSLDFEGMSDLVLLPPPTRRVFRAPMPASARPPLSDGPSGTQLDNGPNCTCNTNNTVSSPGGGATTPTAGTTPNVATPTSGATPVSSTSPGMNPSTSQANANGGVALYDGASTFQTVLETIPGLGMNWSLELTYRSDTSTYGGPLGNGWEMNYNQRLEVVTASNLATFQAVFPNAKVGDVDVNSGYNRDDLYVLNLDGSYTSPAGYFSRLVLNPDGTYTERADDGTTFQYNKPDGSAVATMSSDSDRNGNTMRFLYNDQDQLVFVYDTYGRPIQYQYNGAGLLTNVTDYSGRVIRFTYDANGDLTSTTTPAVTGTPTGNDFPNGSTTRYTYTSGFGTPSLNHELLTVTAPNEVASGGPPMLTYTYDALGRVAMLQEGGTNQSTVGAGGTITYQYQTLGPAGPGDYATPTNQTTATDRNGNVTRYQYNQHNNTLSVRQFNNRGVDSTDPASYTTVYTYNADYKPTKDTMPQGNSFTYTYDSANPSRFSQGNLLGVTETPDAARGGDQSAITTTYTYEPIYNQVRTMTDPRGNDPAYVPQNGGATSPARYTTTYTYDYQEGSDFGALGAPLGLSAAQAAALLAGAGIPMGLGDVNHDGVTNQIDGKLIRESDPTVTLLPGSNEAAVEGSTSQPIVTLHTYNGFGLMTSTTDPEGNVTTYQYYPYNDPNGDGILDNSSGNTAPGGYLRQTIQDSNSAPGRDSGANPAPAQIKTTYQYNVEGEMTRQIDGRGIATDYTYNALDRVVEITHAAATGLYGASSSEPLPLTQFRYTERFFYDYNGNVVLREVEDRGNTSNVQGNLPVADLPTLGILVAGTSTGANTTTTLNDATQAWTPDQYAGMEVKIISGTGAGQLASIAGNTATSLAIGQPWAITPDSTSKYVIYPLLNADPAGGATAYQDTSYKYDILNQPVEMDQEVTNGANPVFLTTRYRYDPDGNQVLTIFPEGNANASVYDERNLLYRSIRGDTSPPPLVLLSPTDPTNYDVRGGTPSVSETYRYDGNGNVVESVNADDNDFSSANNDPTLGPGDRTRYIYDGFDRRTSVVDSVGNQTVYQYDPVGNVIRTTEFGPTGGPSPTSDGPATLLKPVSSLGVIQSANLVNSNMLASTEWSYDELDRNYQRSQVLFVNTIPTARTPDLAEGGSSVGLGNLTPGQTQPVPGVSGVTILGRVSDRTEYDRDSRRTFQVADDVNTTRTLYDGVGRAVKTIDGEGNTTENAYDADSNVIETRQTDVSQVPGVPNEIFLTTYYYDSLNRVIQTVDNLGQTTYNRYDSRNNVVARADANDSLNGSITRRAYPDGPRTVDNTNGFGNVTLHYYDGLNRQVRTEQVLTPSGLGDGTHIGASIYGVKNVAGDPSSFPPAADPAQGGGDGLIRTGYEYDGNSLLSSMIDDNGNVTIYLYDNLDRNVVQASGLTTNSPAYTYSSILGTRVVPTPLASTINNPAVIPQAEIQNQLNEAYAAVQAVKPLFPALANSTLSPPQTQVWGFSPNNDTLIYQDANLSTTFTKYDAIQRVIAVRVFRSGQSDSFAGDPVFAPAPVFLSGSSGVTVTGTNSQNFQYDGLSRMTLATDNNDPTTSADDSTVTDAYDSLGRIIEEAQTIGGAATRIISSGWRADQLRSSLDYPNGRVEVYTYDHDDRLKTAADQGASQPIAVYDYIGVDRVLDRLYPQNGTRETYLDNSNTTDIGYDGAARPTDDRTLRSDNSLVVGFTYTYDRMGNKLTEEKLHDVPDSESYAYDSAYRLVGFRRGVGGLLPLQSSWNLNGVGSPVAVNGVGQQFSSLNQLTNQAGGAAVLYDRNGNETDDGTYTYTYDAFNRLRTVTRKAGGALVATYSYDGQGRRIAKVVTNSGAQDGTTTFALDGIREIQENNAAGVLTQQYVYGVGVNEVLVLDRNLNGDGTATGPGDQRLFYNENALGSIYALTNISAQILEGDMYDAYGRQTVFSPGTGGVVTFTTADVVAPAGLSLLGNPFFFAGMRLDGETNLYYDRARYYNPIQNQYLSQDAAGSGMHTANLYIYAGDNPTNLVDPSGLVCSCKPRLIFGNSIVATDKSRYKSWRAYLYYLMKAIPSNTKLELTNHAWGAAYFGFWYRHGTPKADSTLDIICMGDACTIDSSLTGQIESEDSVVRVYTHVDRQRNGDTLRVEVTMGAALSASGGPEISGNAAVEGIGGGIKMTWPDAKYGAVEAMGTFIWKCEK